MGRVAEASVRPGDLGGVMPILGTGGADAPGGTAGRDVLDDLAGGDTLGSGAGAARMMGGYGDDGLLLEAGDDWLDGGPGEDRVAVAEAEAARVDLANTGAARTRTVGSDAVLWAGATGDGVADLEVRIEGLASVSSSVVLL